MKNKEKNDLVVAYVERLKEKENKERLFRASALFLKMVSDIFDSNYILDEEYWSYNKDKVKKELGWEDISNEDIKMFFECMSKMDGNYDRPPYSDTSKKFNNVTLYKNRLKVFMMFGQGTSITISKNE